MKAFVAALMAGLLFGLGLGVAGMTQADKVINFLDLTDKWDPSLALVMVGGIGAHLIVYRLILRRSSPIFGSSFGIPTRVDIDPRLVGGAALFGVGWGLGGYCPGPGLVSIGSLGVNAVAFVAMLTVGMVGFNLVEAQLSRMAVRQAAQPADGEQPAK